MDAIEEKILNMLEEVRAFRRANDYPSAWQRLQLAISLCPPDGNNLLGRLRAMQGQLNRDKGKMEEAINYYEQALVLFREGEDPLKTAHILRHLAEMEEEVDHLEIARDYFQKCRQAYEALPDASQMDLANFYRAYALFLEKTQQDQAEVKKFWQKARDIYRQFGIVEGVEECDNHLDE